MSLWPSLEKFQASTPYGVGSAHKDVGVNILTGVQKVGQVRSLAHLARAALLALSRLCSLLSLAALAPCRPSSLRAVLTPVRGRVGIVIAQVRLARLINHDPKCLPGFMSGSFFRDRLRISCILAYSRCRRIIGAISD